MDVLCLGELLIDMIGEDTGSLKDMQSFRKYAGGAAGNVAVGVSKLGLKSSFLGRLSTDGFGDFLVQTMEDYGVCSDLITRDSEHKTTIAFVSLNEKKVPSYLFYRDASASSFYCPEDLRESAFRGAKALYFSSLSLAKRPIRDANYTAVKYAEENNLIVAFDPNIRLSVWQSPDAAKQEIFNMFPHTDILKLNDDEIRFLFGSDSLPELCRRIFEEYSKMQLIAITLGPDGTFLMDKRGEYCHVPAVDLPVIDTCGAGDTFMSAVLAFWIRNQGVSGEKALKQLGLYANAAAYITASRNGVIPSMPYQNEVEELLQKLGCDK